MSKARSAHSSALMRNARKFFVSAFVIVTFVAYVLHERATMAEGEIGLLLPVQKATVAIPTVERPQSIGAPPDNEQAPLPPASPLTVALATPTSAPGPSEIVVAQPSPAPLQTMAAAVQKLFTSYQQATPAVLVSPVQPTATAETSTTVALSLTPQPTATVPPTATAQTLGLYKDGEYTGSTADAFYGWVQVDVLIQDSKLVDIQFLQYPDHRRTSVRINQRAAPILQREALQSQDARVDLISGATLTSRAFRQSLQAALDAAKS